MASKSSTIDKESIDASVPPEAALTSAPDDASPAAAAPRFSKRTKLLAAGAAVVLVLAGAGGGIAFAADVAAQEQAAAERAAAEALELANLNEQYTDQVADAQILTDLVPGFIAAGTGLLPEADTLELVQLVEVVVATIGDGAPADASNARMQSEVDMLERGIDDLRSAFDAAAVAGVATAQARLDAAPSADPAVRQSVVDAQAALSDASGSPEAFIELVTVLVANVAATEASHAAAVAAAAAAAEAARIAAEQAADQEYRRTGGRSGTRAPSNGGSGGSVGGGGSPSAPGVAAYTNADARAAVSSRYGGIAVHGNCFAANYGTWTRGSQPPPPVYAGTLGWEAGANAAGTGGWVNYYSCE